MAGLVNMRAKMWLEASLNQRKLPALGRVKGGHARLAIQHPPGAGNARRFFCPCLSPPESVNEHPGQHPRPRSWADRAAEPWRQGCCHHLNGVTPCRGGADEDAASVPCHPCSGLQVSRVGKTRTLMRLSCSSRSRASRGRWAGFHHLDQIWSSSLSRPRQGSGELVCPLQAFGLHPVCICDSNEIRRAWADSDRGDASALHMGLDLLIAVTVPDQEDDIGALIDGGAKLRQRELKPAIAGDRDDWLIGRRQGSPDRSRWAIAK